MAASPHPTYLTPADARAAFQQGNVDAWAIWDPYYSAALLQGGVRVLKDGPISIKLDRFIWQLVPMQKKTALLFRAYWQPLVRPMR
ncbi:putative aliphatic sulfonates-binding domain protein [Escherichia coli 5-172-05_S3_C3]|nr:putative aliphatic sulfonates-binding domain protein [Escherichia coli 5-172-05_S3_C3]